MSSVATLNTAPQFYAAMHNTLPQYSAAVCSNTGAVTQGFDRAGFDKAGGVLGLGPSG